MLIFAISDKGGTGRSVTSGNIVYRRSLQGNDVCYVDFDFGSPTVGAIFSISEAERGTRRGGTHRYLQGEVAEPHRIDIWAESDREGLRVKPPGAGQLVLYPGDEGGGEFPTLTEELLRQCVRLFSRLDEEFDLVMVDLSAGRSFAAHLALAATARLPGVHSRWLVFHRWTRQHIIAAAGLVNGERGLLDVGAEHGHDPAELADRVRFVRTAVLEQDSAELAGLRPTQLAWLNDCDRELRELSARHKVGRTRMLGKVPLDPVLQWREQLISDEDVLASQIANAGTVAAFDDLAKKVVDDNAWEGL
ncbi:SCO2523 family variant P-loop protein [Sphaerisporangium sp. TRM90804]|uniref:SCO2523 family variant P-loop protein n=1 Tax=Sphaerisporangium sp. TRM90804 TaxID=3031113 RepID=UPI00244A917B|nr:SCO2523 family variant P-loop protein [Sphaerisporangium sp. TRM90804]MDH2424336.1 SCO2523 family variant P-loop protein [Sphaerisporangium sp. TRM90804]